MPIKLFCNLDRQTVFGGGTLSGNLVLVSDEEQNDDTQTLPKVYFRLVGVESVKIFELNAGIRRNSKVFLDTVFTLDETCAESEFASPRLATARFKFNLPKTLPSSCSIGDLPASSHADKTHWIDSSSGVHYSLLVSLEAMSLDVLQKMDDARLSESTEKSGSMDLYTSLPVNVAQTDNNYHLTRAGLRLQVDSFLEESILHRGPLVESVTKKISDSIFTESKPLTFSVSIDQYVIVLDTAFPILISVSNLTSHAVEKLDTKLVAKVVAYAEGKSTSLDYLISSGPSFDIVVPPNNQVEDVLFWFRLSDDIKVPSSHSTAFLRISYDLILTALTASGHSIELSIPVFISRGAQISSTSQSAANMFAEQSYAGNVSTGLWPS